MTQQLRIGIVGSGFMGGVHARAATTAGAVIAGTVGRNPEETEAAVAALGAERGYRSVAELAADVDVVHICTPNFTHADFAAEVIATGIPVVCEKPLATSVSDARRVTELAAEAELLACVPFVYRFYPAVREARARIAAGEAGPLWLLHGSYLQDWMATATAGNWRADPAQGGASRAFGDIGVHWCDLMEFVTGHRIVSLAARLGSAFPGRGGTEDGAAVLFRTDQGATGSVVVSQVSPGRKNRLWFEFDGRDASYSFDQQQPDTLWVGGVKSNQTVHRGPDTMGDAAAPYTRLPAGHPQGYQDAFNSFVGDVYASLQGHKPDGLPTFADGLRAATLTQAVVVSAAENTWVDIDPI